VLERHQPSAQDLESHEEHNREGRHGHPVNPWALVWAFLVHAVDGAQEAKMADRCDRVRGELTEGDWAYHQGG